MPKEIKLRVVFEGIFGQLGSPDMRVPYVVPGSFDEQIKLQLDLSTLDW